MKIFYSWQTDAPRKTNKDFIFESVHSAIDEIQSDLTLSEAEREGIQVDQDTQGVLGSPDIARVIFEKISASDLVVADVSLVAMGTKEKPHINSNVAIELGYTYGKLGDKALLKIMNTHFGAPEHLPFDLRVRRHPVKYSLDPNAGKDVRDRERRRLSKEIARILKEYLSDSSFAQTDQPEHPETQSTKLRGIYWQPNQALIPRDNHYDRDDLIWDGDRALYFRCIPEKALPPLSATEASDATRDLWPLMSSGGFSRSRNRWGGISHCIAQDGELMGVTQVFRNREIWGIDFYHTTITTKPVGDGNEPLPYLASGALQREFPRAIDSMRELARELGYGSSYIIEMGLSGADGMHIAVDHKFFDKFPGPFFETEVFLRQTISSETPTNAIMNEFWKLLFDEIAHAVPSDLVWDPKD